MPWWRVLLETWWWVLCGVALGAIGARVLLSRPPLPAIVPTTALAYA